MKSLIKNDDLTLHELLETLLHIEIRVAPKHQSPASWSHNLSVQCAYGKLEVSLVPRAHAQHMLVNLMRFYEAYNELGPTAKQTERGISSQAYPCTTFLGTAEALSRDSLICFQENEVLIS